MIIIRLHPWSVKKLNRGLTGHTHDSDLQQPRSTYCGFKGQAFPLKSRAPLVREIREEKIRIVGEKNISDFRRDEQIFGFESLYLYMTLSFIGSKFNL